MYKAKNKNIKVKGADIDYIEFGTGKKVLIMIPGVGDGIKTAKGMAGIFSIMYKEFAKDYRVYVFSRRNNIEEGFTTKDMAEDVYNTLKVLGISKCDVIGVSQGGMISQYLAINHPEVINKLVLAITSPCKNLTMIEAITPWLEWAHARDFKKIFIDTAERSYTEEHLKRYRWLYGVLYKFSRPKSYKRFIIQCMSCLEHNAYDELGKIKCPTLIIGAAKDRIVGVEASRELHKKIKTSELYIYKKYSHGVYEEEKDFFKRILKYLEK